MNQATPIDHQTLQPPKPDPTASRQSDTMERDRRQSSLIQYNFFNRDRASGSWDGLIMPDRPQSPKINDMSSDRPLLPQDELEQLYEQAPCGYHSLDANGLYIRINQTELTMLGYRREELLHQKMADLLTPASQATFAANFPRFMQQGWIRDVEFEMIRRDGSILLTSISATAIYDAAGNYQMSRSVMLDISDRHRLQTEQQQATIDLQEAHQRIVTTWETMTDAYVSYDLDWRFTYANQAAIMVVTHLSGVAPQAILGKTHWEVFPTLAGGEFEQRYRAAIATQTPVHFELRYEPTGDWFEIHAYPSPIGLGVYFRDITDRKEADKTIREQAALLDIASDAIYVCDLEQRILYWNRGAERLYGWSAKQAIGQNVHELLQEPEAESNAIMQTLLAQGAWQGEIHRVTQAGRAIVVDVRWTLVQQDGTPKSILNVDTDITQKKQLETQFLRAQRLESLGTLASGIAHDLNNILTPMIGIVQLLPVKIPNLDPPTQRLLQILGDSSRRGADLVKQILSFTRGIEGTPTNTQIKHLIAEIQKVVQQTFPKNIDLVLELPRELWLIAADATLLHQVLMNLAVNARDAMPEGGTLQITAENLAIDENYARMNLDAQIGNYVVVTIADTGMGMPPEIVDRIFDPFFTTKPIGQGTGLGLSTVIGIINSHHGFVNVYSEVGKGTRFKIYLPASDTSATDTPIVDVTMRSGNGELILVVDDESAVQEVTKTTLETYGYQAMIASDGVDAIACYAEHKKEIRVVLLDLMMPALDSPTVIRTLCKLNPEVQIIAMSGLATNESITRTIGDGVQAFLAKPFTATELLDALDRVLTKT
jgi:PAS domain S-box-containing protein